MTSFLRHCSSARSTKFVNTDLHTSGHPNINRRTQAVKEERSYAICACRNYKLCTASLTTVTSKGRRLKSFNR